MCSSQRFESLESLVGQVTPVGQKTQSPPNRTTGLLPRPGTRASSSSRTACRCPRQQRTLRATRRRPSARRADRAYPSSPSSAPAQRNSSTVRPMPIDSNTRSCHVNRCTSAHTPSALRAAMPTAMTPQTWPTTLAYGRRNFVVGHRDVALRRETNGTDGRAGCRPYRRVAMVHPLFRPVPSA